MESISSSSRTEGKNMPSVDSDDPAERKLARRMRIQARLEAAEKQKAIDEGTYKEPEPALPLIATAVDESQDAIQRLYLEGKELVTNIMVASDAKEVARRERVAEEKNIRLEKLKDDSSKALEKLDEISDKWETIMELNGPLELFENMKEQKAKCLELIEQKNELIKSFHMELKLADEKYMKGRKSMYEELALLTRRIDEQVLLMKRAYRLELTHIDEAIEVTRSEITDKHQHKWLSYYNQREKEETTNIDRKLKLVESFHEEVHKLHVEHDEQYRAMRINLETDIQILEQELEQVKALCLLNSEKLDYNYQVLKKREEENLYIKNHQKRRLNKLQDMVNTLKKKIDEKRQSTDEEYKRLVKEVDRYYKAILDTEEKAELFAYSNDDKFINIWTMKDEESRDLLEKILAADMVINEQILGLEWTRPPNTVFNKMDMIFYKTAAHVVNGIKRRKLMIYCKGAGKKPQFIVDQSGKDLREKDNSPEVAEGHGRLLSHILTLIANQSGFLMEEKLDELLGPYTEDEKTFVRLDNVFMAIDIQLESELDEMKKVFLPYTFCLLCDRKDSRTDNEEKPDHGRKKSDDDSILQIRELEEKVSKLRLQKMDEDTQSEGIASYRSVTGRESGKMNQSRSRSPSRSQSQSHSVKKSQSQPQSGGTSGHASKCDITHPLIIDKIYVLRALRDFVAAYHSDRIRRLTEISEKLQQKRITLSRMISREDIVAYWVKYREAIPSHLENQWDAVFEALTRYLKILKERHLLNKRAENLRRQNLELKRLLSQYKLPFTCDPVKLPMIPPVPTEPIDGQEISILISKLYR